jgi:hypothetical protein
VGYATATAAADLTVPRAAMMERMSRVSDAELQDIIDAPANITV